MPWQALVHSRDAVSEENVTTKLISTQMFFVCFWNGLGPVFGARNSSEMHTKRVRKTCLHLEAILEEFGGYFGSLFRLRMGGPGQNSRFRSGSSLSLRFQTAQVGAQGGFLEEIYGFVKLFRYYFGAHSFKCGITKFSES